MLKIRLARHGRKNLPFYRIVLTEHTRPAQSGYKLVLWRYNPIAHEMDVNLDEVKLWLSKWAQLSERVAKLLFAKTKDDMFKKYFVERTSTKALEIHNKRIEEEKAAKAEKEAAEAEAKAKAAAEAQETPAEESVEATTETPDQADAPVAESETTAE